MSRSALCAEHGIAVQAISKEGWKLVTLLRLSPLVPWSLLNYALSITGASPPLYMTSMYHLQLTDCD